MSTIFQRLFIVTRWLASFFRRDWRPEDYPIHVSEQAGVPEDAKWCACVLNWPGPVGLGSTKEAARMALEANLRAIAATRRAEGKAMPRPGTDLSMEFESDARADDDPALRDEFIIKALGFQPDDPVFISDESTIADFGDDERSAEIRNNIRKHFGVTVDAREPVRIVDVLDRIRETRNA